MRRRCIEIWVILSCIFLFTACADKTEDTELNEVITEEMEEVQFDKKTEVEKAEWIYIHVCGEVAEPGVYKLPWESRIFEAVEAAGGMTEDAQESAMNLAQQLEDGQQIYVPSKKEAQQKGQGESGGQEDGKVNLNSASREELMTLSGIGEAKADAIIRYREENGGFQSIEDIMKIEGIKEGVFQKVKDQIKTE